MNSRSHTSPASIASGSTVAAITETQNKRHAGVRPHELSATDTPTATA